MSGTYPKVGVGIISPTEKYLIALKTGQHFFGSAF